MMEDQKTRRQNIKKVIEQLYGGNASKFARAMGKSGPYIAAIIADPNKASYSKFIGEKVLASFEDSLKLKRGSLSDPNFDVVKDAPIEVRSSNDAVDPTKEITVFKALGSCGGGKLNQNMPEKYFIHREPDFFYSHDIKPANIIAVYADGDSMSPFIQDGDVVMFDNRQTTVISGQIYLIEHPDGLKIKKISKDLSGAITLTSTNPDKSMYPDEHVDGRNLEYLIIKGKFFYRQGG